MQRFFGVAQDINGNAVPSAAVRVNLAGVATLATLFSDNVYTPLVNPFTSNTDGTYQFYSRDGRYDIILTKTGFTFQNAETADTLLDDNESIVSPAQITANQNDYSPANGLNATTWRLNSDAPRTLTGIAAGFSQQPLVLVNTGSFNIILAHNSGSSVAGNRFSVPIGQNYSLVAGSSIVLQYDLGSSVWRVRAEPFPGQVLRTSVPVTVSNSAAETTIFTGTIPGGMLGTSGRLALSIVAKYTNTTGVDSNCTTRMKYGGTTVNGGGCQSITSTGFSDVAFGVIGELVAGNATNAQLGQVTNTVSPIVTGETIIRNGTAAIDSTVDQTFVVTAQLGAASLNHTFTMQHASLVYWP
jgi:hypothetical protein